MSYHGDITLEDTIDFQFNTFRFSTGAPFTLAGTPSLAAYVGNSTTQITAGLTLTVDFDTVTGYHNVRVVATAANGYAAGTNVTVVLAAGTVDSVSVVGAIVGSFSIENRAVLRPTVKDRKLDVTAANKVNGVVLVDTLTTYTGNTVQTGDSFARIGATGSGLTSLATQASVNTVDDFLDTEVAAILAAVDTEVAAIKAKTDNLPGATLAELPQAALPATPSMEQLLMALYMALRNRLDITASTKSVTNDAGTVIFKKALSDDGTTYSEAEAVSGP